METGNNQTVLLSATQAREQLGISPQSLAKLDACWLLRPVQKSGSLWLYEQRQVDVLRDSRPVEKHPAALCVRLGSPMKPPSGEPALRDYLGWQESGDEDHPPWTSIQKADAARQFWDVKDPDRFVGSALLGSVSEWLVGIWNIDGWQSHPGSSRLSALVSPATDEQNKVFKGRRLWLGQGPVAIPLEPNAAIEWARKRSERRLQVQN
jgi:hypothetical protein